MPANQKVSVPWQIVATFVPIANFWAFYRIRKLRKYLLYTYVPALITSLIVFSYVYSDGFRYYRPFDPEDPGLCDSPILNRPWQSFTLDDCVLRFYAMIIGQVIGWCLFGFSIYLVIIWSRQHNRNFDTPPPTEPPT